MGAELALIIRIAIAAAAAVLFGNGSVVAFNRINPSWFEDYDETDTLYEAEGRKAPRKILPRELEKADAAGRQRLPSTPWKYIFISYFAITGIYLAIRNGSITYEISVLCVLFIVLEMAISDQLYKVVPDQFSIMLAVLSVSFLSYHDKWWEPAAGAALGLAISLAVLGLGMLLFRTGSIGGADIKFFTCMGFIAGRMGIAVIFVLTTLCFAVYSAVKIAAFGGSVKDRNALMPSACAAVTIYFLFLFNIGELLVLEL